VKWRAFHVLCLFFDSSMFVFGSVLTQFRVSIRSWLVHASFMVPFCTCQAIIWLLIKKYYFNLTKKESHLNFTVEMASLRIKIVCLKISPTIYSR